MKEYKDNGGRYGTTTFVRRFGGWLKALMLCGLAPDKSQIDASSGTYTQSYITTRELIDDLKRVSLLIDKSNFSSHEYNQNGKYSSTTYFKRFKTWNNALSAAGLIPFEVTPGRRVSEYDALEEIERIWIKLGRQPTTTDIQNGISKYSLHVFDRCFGSWRKALEVFVSYMNGEQEIKQPEDAENEIKLPDNIQERMANVNQTHKTKRNVNLRMRFLVMKRDNFKCCICGRSPATTPGLELHIDHIKPWSKGGETTINNLQTLCSDCNQGKSNLSEDS